MQDNFKEVFRYLRAAYRYRLVAILLALVVMTGVGSYSLTLSKIYKADTTVFIEKSVIDNLVRGIAVTPSINDKIRVLRYALLSRNLIVKTLEEIESEIFTKPKAEQQAYIAGLQEQIKINVRGNDLFIVTLEGTQPAFIQNFINTLVGLYVEENTAAQREEAYGANRFLDEQIESFKIKLEQAEDAITQFRKEQGIFFTLDEKGTLEEIKKYLAEIEALELTIETLRSKKTQLQQQLSTLSPTIESVFSLDNGVEDGFVVNPLVAAMEQKLADLRLRYTDNYPEIVRLKFELEALKQQLAQQQSDDPIAEEKPSGGSRMTSLNPLYLDVQQRLLEIEGDLSEAQSKKRNFERLISKRETELNEVPEVKKRLNVMIQERDSYQKVYQDLLGRKGQSEVSKQMEIGNKTATFRVVDPAVYPERPVAPNLLKWLALALAGGLGSAAGLIFLLENLDGRVRSAVAIEEMGVEILAIIPTIADVREIAARRRQDLVLFSLTGLYGLAFLGAFGYIIYLK